MKIKKLLALALALCLMTALMSGCKKDEEYYDEDLDYYEDDYDDWDDDDPYVETVDSFSFDGMTISEDLASKIYSAMQAYSFEYYKTIDTAQWAALGADEKLEAYNAFLGILTDIGFPVGTDSDTWISLMDSDADFYSNYMIWGFAFKNLGFNDTDKLISLGSYAQGVDEGKYASLHPDIFANADDVTVEYYSGQYLLCVGQFHNIIQMTRDWTMEEAGFMMSGSITPIATGDYFEDVSISFSLDGSSGVFDNAYFGDADLLPVLEYLGAIGSDGTMLANQIQVSAKSVFDAPLLFILTEDDYGYISFAVMEYREDDGMYIWYGDSYDTAERSCFDSEGDFCYIDLNGQLQWIVVQTEA